MDKWFNEDKFHSIKHGFSVFNSNNMPPIGTKIKVEWADLSQTYEYWEGNAFEIKERGDAIFYRLADTDDKLEALLDIHYVIMSWYTYGYYGSIANNLQYHLENTDDKNILKTILVSTKHLKNHPNFKRTRDKITDKLNYLLGEIMP